MQMILNAAVKNEEGASATVLLEQFAVAYVRLSIGRSGRPEISWQRAVAVHSVESAPCEVVGVVITASQSPMALAPMYFARPVALTIYIGYAWQTEITRSGNEVLSDKHIVHSSSSHSAVLANN